MEGNVQSVQPEYGKGEVVSPVLSEESLCNLQLLIELVELIKLIEIVSICRFIYH